MVGAVIRGNGTSQCPVCSAIARFSIEGRPDSVSVSSLRSSRPPASRLRRRRVSLRPRTRSEGPRLHILPHALTSAPVRSSQKLKTLSLKLLNSRPIGGQPSSECHHARLPAGAASDTGRCDESPAPRQVPRSSHKSSSAPSPFGEMTLRDLARFGLLFTTLEQSANEPAVSPAFLKALLEKSIPICKPATSRHGAATPRISGTASAARAAVERLRELALPHSTLCCIAQCPHTAPTAASLASLPD